jgi:hypothetical protein
MVLSVVILLGLPIAGAAGGGLGAVWAVSEKAEPEANPAFRACGMMAFGNVIVLGFAGSAGAVTGFIVGLAVAWYSTLALAEWSTRGTSDDEDDF